MNFKQWFVEAITTAAQNKFVQIANQYFGDAQNVDLQTTASGQLTLSGELPELNRVVDATLDDRDYRRPYVIINFDWLNHNNAGSSAQNVGGMATGTKEFMTRLKQFVQALQQAGIGVAYHALGAGQSQKEIQAREKLYSRGLQKTGFQRASMPNAVNQAWFPRTNVSR